MVSREIPPSRVVVPLDRGLLVRQAVGYLLFGSLLLYFGAFPNGTWLQRLADASTLLGVAARAFVVGGATCLYLGGLAKIARFAFGTPVTIIDETGVSTADGLRRHHIRWSEIRTFEPIRNALPADSRVWFWQSESSRLSSARRTRVILPLLLTDGRHIVVSIPQPPDEAASFVAQARALWRRSRDTGLDI